MRARITRHYVRAAAAGPTAAGGFAKPRSMSARKDSAFLFDLDGTLIDSVYQHVIAWREALERARVSTRRSGGSTGASG